MAIQVYKFHADPTGKSYVTNVNGIWRGIADPNLIPEELKANAPTTSDETYRGTSGGAMSYGALLAHQAGIDEQARIRALPQTTFDPTKAQTSTFRPRGAGEDMTSYLQAKQAQEMQTTGSSAISFGTPQVAVAQPTAQPAPIAPQPASPVAPATQQTPQLTSTNPTDYYKVNTGNIGPDGKPIYDIYSKTTGKLTGEQGMPLFKAGLNVDHIPEQSTPSPQPSQPAQGAGTTQPMTQQPTPAQQPTTGQPEASSEVSATQPYVRYLGSPDIFEASTGRYVTEAEGKADPSIFSKVEDIPTPRPGVQTEEDFKKLERTNLQLQQSGATTTPQDFQNNPLKAFQDTYSQIWNNLGLNSVKEQIETTLKAIKEVDFEMIDKVAEVNDNPWISEAERSKQVIKLQGKYEQKNKANTENLKLLQGLFETGQKEAQFVSSNALDVYYKERTFDENEKLKAMDIAEKMSVAMNKKSFQDLVGSDGRMHTYIVNEAGEKLADLGVSEIPKAGGGATGTPSVSDENGQRITVLDSTSSTYVNDLFNSNIGGKKVTQVELLRPLQKALTVSSQLGELSTLVKNTNTDPIIGSLRSMNPYDFDARAIQATLQAIVPNLARGVYGEVGVLTDNDIKNYIQTLPNIKSTEQQNKFVMGMTLRSLQSGLLAQLEVLQAGGYDLSGFRNSYDKMARQANDIEKDLGIGKKVVTQNVSNEEFLKNIPTFGPPAPAQTDNKSFFGGIYDWLTGR